MCVFHNSTLSADDRLFPYLFFFIVRLLCRCECWVKHELQLTTTPTQSLCFKSSHTFVLSFLWNPTDWVGLWMSRRHIVSIYVYTCVFSVVMKHLGECCYRKIINDATEHEAQLLTVFFIPLTPITFDLNYIITHVWFINKQHIMLFSWL